MTEKEFLFNFKKSYEIFLWVEKVIEKGLFPIVTGFVNEEITFWKNTVQTSPQHLGTFLELGCGCGRAIAQLKNFGLEVIGIDNNPFMVEHCQRRGLKVFQADILNDPVPTELKNQVNFAGIGFNTLFNFSPDKRKRWIDFAHQSLSQHGTLMISLYIDNKEADKYIEQRVGFYRKTAMAPDDHQHEYYETKTERGIRLKDSTGNIIWHSAWIRKQDVLNEARTWSGFKVKDFLHFPCKIGNLLVLEKI